MSAVVTTPTLAEILLGLAHTLDWKAEQHDRRRTAHPFGYRTDDVWAGSEDVAMRLGLWEIHEVEPEWCKCCSKLLLAATFYRTVPWGRVTAIGRQMGKLARAGLVEKNERYPSLYRLTAEGEALIDDAQDAALAVLREALE